MVLHRENRLGTVAKTLARLVVEIDLGGFHLGRGQGAWIDRKPVILGGDADPARGQVLDRLVAAAMTELELEGLSPERVAENLVAQANAEDRLFADERPDGLVGVGNDGRIARAVREKNAVRVGRERLVRRRRGGENPHLKAVLAQPAQDVGLQAEVEGRDPVRHRRQWREIIFSGEGRRAGRALALDERPLAAELVFGVPIVGLGAGDLLDEVALEVRPLFGEIDRRRVRHLFRGHHAAQRALRPQPERQRPRVDAGQARNVVALEVGIERLDAAPTAHHRRKLAHDEAGDVGLARLDVERVDPGVADERVGHGHDLPLVGRIGQDFLVPGHRGVEADFAVGGEGGAERLAAPDAAVFEGEKGWSHPAIMVGWA